MLPAGSSNQLASASGTACLPDDPPPPPPPPPCPLAQALEAITGAIAGKCSGQNCLAVTHLTPSQRNAALGGEACADQSLLDAPECANVTTFDRAAPTFCQCERTHAAGTAARSLLAVHTPAMTVLRCPPTCPRRRPPASMRRRRQQPRGVRPAHPQVLQDQGRRRRERRAARHPAGERACRCRGLPGPASARPPVPPPGPQARRRLPACLILLLLVFDGHKQSTHAMSIADVPS